MKGEGITVKCETVPCMVCKKSTIVEMSRVQYELFIQGGRISEIFPDWSLEDRELLISGTHPNCWDELFGEDDEDGE